jgi:hypothetical protein
LSIYRRGQRGNFHARDENLQIEAVKQRPREPATIAGDTVGRAATAASRRVAIIAALAGSRCSFAIRCLCASRH